MALAAVGLLLLAVLAGRWYLGTAVPDPRREGRVASLSAPVDVWRDAYAIAHVWAANEADLMRAIGYVHAQERLWQMELLRRTTQGRLAEVLGADLVDTDRFLRTLGMRRAAQADEALLEPSERSLLEAYAEGVNAWLRSRPGALPPELLLLGLTPEPWTALDSLAISKAMAWNLTLWELELNQQRILDLVGPEKAREAEPLYPDWGATTWSGPVAPNAPAPAVPPSPAPPLTPGSQGHWELPRIPSPVRELLGRASASQASNVFAVAGSRSTSGKPLLANDMHLDLQTPALWYLAALHGGGIEAVGMTLPGLPFVIVGRTRDVSWGLSASQIDDVDYFIEQVDAADASRYLAPGGSRPFETRTEEIRVKGGAPVSHVVRTTRHGPVLSDVMTSSANGRVLALRWAAHEPGRSFHALLGMNRARTLQDFTRALESFDSPSLNVVYADRDTLGFQVTGRIPIRRGGDGLRPAPGWTDAHEWTGFLTPEQAPHGLQPADGLLINSNNRQAARDYPYFLTRRWAEPFRAMRIRELLEGTPQLTVEQMARLQRDVRDTFALRYLPHAIRGARRAGLPHLAEQLEHWDGEAGPDSRAAALFYVWFQELEQALSEDEAAGRELPFSAAAVVRVLEAGGGVWVDDTRTPQVEGLEELTARAWTRVEEKVKGRPWGELHHTVYEHAMGTVRPLDWLLGLNVGPVPSGGSWHTVDATDLGSERLPYESHFGASERQVVDMGDAEAGGWFLLPTGQSGLPFSPHYRDQVAPWQAGRLLYVPLSRASAEALAVDRAVLRPGSPE